MYDFRRSNSFVASYCNAFLITLGGSARHDVGFAPRIIGRCHVTLCTNLKCAWHVTAEICAGTAMQLIA